MTISTIEVFINYDKDGKPESFTLETVDKSVKGFRSIHIPLWEQDGLIARICDLDDERFEIGKPGSREKVA
jgi:hypothetical protein